MPIHIEDVQADVSVEPRATAAQESAQKRPLPAAHELQRYLQLARNHAWDHARTHTLDRDD
ncbi:hypothetical protein BWI17_06275 [Betaproteobacteria bacterium GR16-43]|nr:hypothetical protein BWI17_06275 [Betaproteobacteria bacterium GR16-43]